MVSIVIDGVDEVMVAGVDVVGFGVVAFWTFGLRSFFLRLRGLIIRGRQVSDDVEEEEEFVIPGLLSSLATEWLSFGCEATAV